MIKETEKRGITLRKSFAAIPILKDEGIDISLWLSAIENDSHMGGVQIFIGDSYKEELGKLGIKLEPNTAVRYDLVGEYDEIDKAAAFLQADAKLRNIDFIPLIAQLNYDIVSEKATDGLLYLKEDIINPSSHSDYETLLDTYVDNLHCGGKHLIIIDPYIFPKNYDADYMDLLGNVIAFSKAAKVTFITAKEYDVNIFPYVKSKNPSIDFRLVLNDEFHDRFWYCAESNEALSFGTSLNGIGRKFSRIDKLREDEVAIIKTEVERILGTST